MIPQFGQIIHIHSDRGNRQAVLNLAELDNQGKATDTIWSGRGFRPEEQALGIPTEILKFTQEDAYAFLYQTYGIIPEIIQSFLQDWDIGRLVPLAQIDRGCGQFLNDILTYMHSPDGQNPVKEKSFQYLQQTGGRTMSGQPMMDIVV